MTRPLLVVDGDSFAHCAYHALPKTIRRPGNRGAGAILGFANFLLKIYEAEKPRAVLVGWDSLDEPTYRQEALAGYQGGREFDDELVEQLEVLPEFAVAKEEKRGGRAIVATGDRDAFQLVSDKTTILSFTDLADQERRLVSGAEREILNDFLAFVDKNFPKLGPFNTLGRCAGEPSRVRRRLDAILNEVLKTDILTLPGIHTSVKRAALEYDSEERLVKLRMWPADTLEQARSFYARPETVERLLKLQNEGWNVRSNFHFGFTATGYCWTTTTMPVAEYMRYWLERIHDAGKIMRRDWDGYWRNLVNKKIAEPGDRERFDRDFTNTERASATPRPGVACMFDWRLDKAEGLDARGQLRNAIRKRINQLLEALGEDRINPE